MSPLKIPHCAHIRPSAGFEHTQAHIETYLLSYHTVGFVSTLEIVSCPYRSILTWGHSGWVTHMAHYRVSFNTVFKSLSMIVFHSMLYLHLRLQERVRTSVALWAPSGKKRIVNKESNKVIKKVRQINLFKELSNLIRTSRVRSRRTSEVKTHVVRFVFLLRVNLLLREADGGHAGVAAALPKGKWLPAFSQRSIWEIRDLQRT